MIVVIYFHLFIYYYYYYYYYYYCFYYYYYCYDYFIILEVKPEAEDPEGIRLKFSQKMHIISCYISFHIQPVILLSLLIVNSISACQIS